jgi:hypothetical protein
VTEKHWDLDESSSGSLDFTPLIFGDDQYVKKIEKLKEVDSFLEDIKEKSISEGFPEYNIALEAEKLWLDLQSEYDDLIPVPLVSLGIDGSVLFTIRDQHHYLELEVVEGGIEFFYENENTGESEFEELEFGLSIINNIETWLLKIASSS